MRLPTSAPSTVPLSGRKVSSSLPGPRPQGAAKERCVWASGANVEAPGGRCVTEEESRRLKRSGGGAAGGDPNAACGPCTRSAGHSADMSGSSDVLPGVVWSTSRHHPGGQKERAVLVPGS